MCAQLYACGCTCDHGAVHPRINQSQNAILPGAPRSAVTWAEGKAAS